MERQVPRGDLLLPVHLPARAESLGPESWPSITLWCHFPSTPYSMAVHKMRSHIPFVCFSLSFASGFTKPWAKPWLNLKVSDSDQVQTGPLHTVQNPHPHSNSHLYQKYPFTVWWLHFPDKVHEQINAYYKSCQRRDKMSLNVWLLGLCWLFPLIIVAILTILHHAYVFLLWEEAICLDFLLKWECKLDQIIFQ